MEYWKNKDLKSIPGEEWNDIPGYDGMYRASSLGRILSVERIDSKGALRKALIRSQCINSSGQLCIPLSLNGIPKSFAVAQMVYTAFNGLKSDESLKIGHINKDKLDNRIENLELQTQNKVCSDSHKLGINHDWGIGEFARIETEKAYAEFDLENGNRICTKCFQEKGIQYFYNRPGADRGKNRMCSDCLNRRGGVVDVGKMRYLKNLADAGLKRCPKCTDVKEVTSFYKRKSGFACYCKSCMSNESRLRRILMRDSHPKNTKS